MTPSHTSKEQRVMARAQATLDDGDAGAEALAALLDDYRKLASRMDRLTRISDRQQLQVRQLSDLKDQFVGMAAHDLRNPIALIQGFSTLMLASPDMAEADRTRYLGLINTVSRDMGTLLNDLLDISAIESGTLKLDTRAQRLDAVVAERLDLLGSLAANKTITIRRDLTAVDQVPIDEKRLAQVIDNLISNAIKYSHPGTEITVSVRAEDGHGCLAVADQGQGIPAEELDKVFGTFQRLSVRPTGDEKSHGLGLAIARKIVLAHGGRIGVESTVGEGSVFTVRLPLQA
jgi:signal transduction histidine kinase